MRLIPDEIVGTLAYGTFAGLAPDLSCRVRLYNCDESLAEEVLVPATPEVSELVRSLRIGDWVWVHFWDGKPVRMERP